MKSKIQWLLKGMAMGCVDIVPGVSGSTVAVLLGFYGRFIGALRNIDGALIGALLGPFRTRFSAESRGRCAEAWRRADMPWLCNLLLGLVLAFCIASFVIPALMERFPETMRGLFFGLVLGSIATPVRDMGARSALRYAFVTVIFALAFFVILGLQVEPPTSLVTATADGSQSLADLCRHAPCFLPPGEVLSLPQNASIHHLSPDVMLPAGTTVTLVAPNLIYCFAAGFCGICAMLLPGISGSFMLLVLGCYYFVLNTAKALIHGLVQGEFLTSSLVCIGLFAVGGLLGIALFSRAVAFLLRRFKNATLAAIVGILLGCLRAVWPFKMTTPEGTLNAWPTLDAYPAFMAMAAGLGIVALALWAQTRKKKN